MFLSIVTDYIIYFSVIATIVYEIKKGYSILSMHDFIEQEGYLHTSSSKFYYLSTAVTNCIVFSLGLIFSYHYNTQNVEKLGNIFFIFFIIFALLRLLLLLSKKIFLTSKIK